jgi:phosphoribosylformylglycinamidine cyclo-ligase
MNQCLELKSNKSTTYSDVGIDLKEIHKAQQSVGELISLTHSFLRRGKVLSGFGHYAGLIELNSDILALHSDGVGTKLIIAQIMDSFDTVGIDCVAMNVNDIICVGAQPVGFIDYIALKSSNENLIDEIVKGLVEGAKQSEIAIVGGETAILPDLISGTGENAFDLAGMVLGITSKSRLILGDRIKVGDVILGIESSGLHSNGYSLARKILLSKYSIEEKPEYLTRTLGEELLIPTRIYVKPVMEILEGGIIDVNGFAHITGGSFTKLSRLSKRVRFNLNHLPNAEGIFKQIQIDGHVKTKEMYKTFNMGIGFCVIIPKKSVARLIEIFEKHRMKCMQIGIVDQRGKGEVIARLDGRNEEL